MHLHLLGPKGGVENPNLKARVSASSEGPSKLMAAHKNMFDQYYCFNTHSADIVMPDNVNILTILHRLNFESTVSVNLYL